MANDINTAWFYIFFIHKKCGEQTMKTIRGKLLVYFLIFVVIFEVTAVFIFASSNKITSTYQTSIQRFLLLNRISQDVNRLATDAKAVVADHGAETTDAYYNNKKRLVDSMASFQKEMDNNIVELRNYQNLLETFLHESELTVGFVILNDVEQYTSHLEEMRNTADYVQEATLELIDRELTSYQPFFEALKARNDHFLIFIIFLFTTMGLLAVFFAIWFSKGITDPIRRLTASAKEVAAGKLDGDPVHIASKDELELLGDTFNSMRSSLVELVQEMKNKSELDRLVKEMELKQLQNQINPHFLFNTLNTVSKMAYLEDAKSTSHLIDAIATLLRYSLTDITKHTTLRSEVQVVNDYFLIQKTRFAERVTFSLSVDDACLDMAVPRLTLQPLVENAFIHGIEGKEEGGSIALQIFPKNGSVVVEVQDDGVGMTAERRRQILSLAKEPTQHTGHATGIGLTNVIRRLQLFYQSETVAEINSRIGEGTTIRLLLPRNKLNG
ncbi:sensor histidine kinase [Virgibacillus sp. 179-BFC.A HS]|uniref:histidine kinase n=1 Tax=Tigheibacillus jepli TaxID=3035914 RepID=A0ABU5CEK0_9BACI|nr:sensor histidine kinase [Virgibacillus sp. 179-BFC.A HS]MDY0404760.1 sensor histidine kinase [Virgibacillus sp. 179-BFC.A HS]